MPVRKSTKANSKKKSQSSVSNSAKFVKEEIARRAGEITKIRRDLHANPELGFSEKRTTKVIVNQLKSVGIPVKVTSLGVGAIGEIKGKYSGKTVVLRADIDALPIKESTGLKFASKNKGVMHACGHDAHTAALIGAAKILAEYNARIGLRGNVRFVFQPNEEKKVTTRSGAHLMVREGALKNASAVFAGHMHNYLPPKAEIAGKSGNFLASANKYNITISAPQKHPGIAKFNPFVAQATLISELNKIYGSRKNALIQPISFEFAQKGEKGALTPGAVKLVIRTGMLGSPEKEKQFIRNLNNNIRKIVRKQILGLPVYKSAKKANQKLKSRTDLDGVSIGIKVSRGTPPLYNEPDLMRITRQSSRELGLSFRKTSSLKAADDLSVFGTVKQKGRRVPINYALTGANPPHKTTPHHTPTFVIGDQGAINQAALLAQNAINFLNKK